MYKDQKVSLENIGQRARKGVTWTASAQVVKHVLDFGVGIVMARILTPGDFGVVSACMIFLSFVSIFTSFGFTPAIVQRPEIDDDYLGTAQSIIIALGLCSTVVMSSCAGLIGEIFHNGAVGKVIPLMSLIFVVSSLSIVPSALLTRNMEFGKLTTASIGSSAVYGLVVVGMAVAGFGVWSLVVGPLAGALANGVLLSIFASYYPKLRFDGTYLKELLNFGGAVTASSLLNHVARNADNFIVGRYLGPDLLGLYARAYNLATIPKEIMVSVFGSVLFPSYARMQDDKRRLRDAYFKSINAIVLVTLPISAVFFITSPELITSVYGPKWSGSIVPLRILSLAGFVYTLYIPCSSLLLGLGETKAYTTLQVIYSVGIVLAVYLTFNQGIEQVAAAVSLVIVVGFVAYIAAVHKIFPFAASAYWQSMKVAIVGSVLMVTVLIAARYLLCRIFSHGLWVFLLEAAVAAAIYCCYMLLSTDEVCVEIKASISSKLGIFSGAVVK